jgi:hypothetical protein
MRRARIASAVCMASVMLAGMLANAAQAYDSVAPQISQSEVNALVERADQMGSVDSVEAVSGGARAAQFVVDPSTTFSAAPETPVDVVLMHGQFTDAAARVPPGSPAPTGTSLSLNVNTARGEVAGTDLGDCSPSLASLGVVEHMTPANGNAAASRVGHRTFKRGRGHIKAKVATWGNNCKNVAYSPYYHCYGIAEWAMSGNEQVEGTESEQKTTAMNAAGGIVNNEEWTNFPKGYEVEIGQEAGYRNCCNLFWFMAKKNAEGYGEVNYPPYTGEVTFNTWNNYGDVSAGNGSWCFRIGANWEAQPYCFGGFPVYSKDLQDGMEVASEVEPENAGSVVANATHLNGKIYTWNFATNYAENVFGEYTTHVCVSQYAPVNYPGNINYGTC